MFGWLAKILGAKKDNDSDVLSMSQIEIKRLMCNYDIVDNPAFIHIESARFIIPEYDAACRKVRTFDSGSLTYANNFRCVHFARKLAAYLAGTGWAVGLLTVDIGNGAYHELVSVVVSVKGKPLVFYFDAQTRGQYHKTFKILWGDVA